MDNEKWKSLIVEHDQSSFTTTSPTTQKMIKKMVRDYIPRDAKHILDLGCGDGWSVHYMQCQFPLADVRGLVAMQQEADEAKKLYTSKVDVGDMHEMPYADNSFDCIFAKDVVEHAVCPTLVVREIKRVLKPDGVLVMFIPSLEWMVEKCHYHILDAEQWCMTFLKNGLNVRSLHFQFFRLTGASHFGIRGFVYIVAKETQDVVIEKDDRWGDTI